MATSARTEVPGGKPPFPPFQKETFASQLVWLAIFFVALYVLMSRVAIPRIGGILEARRQRIADDIAAAGKLKEQSDAALATYEKSLADAHARAQAMAGETRDQLNAQAEEARKRLEAELNDKIAAAERQITAAKVAAMTNVRGIAVETAAAIVERLTGAAPAGSTVEAAIADVLKR
jgi:F-type H+-transporting ATPase subunit b